LFRNKFTTTATATVAEVEPALIVVVTAAAQLDPVDRGLATERIGIHVVELHEPPLAATVAGRSHERATPEVPNPDGSLDRSRGRARPLDRSRGRAASGASRRR
jgi:hypothetical protein